MEKGLLFFTLAAGAFWLILDEFYGTKRVSNIATQLTPQMNNPITDALNNVGESIKDFTKWEVKTPAEKEKSYKKTIDDINKNDNIKSNDAKKAMQDLVTDFYMKSGGMVSS